MPVTEFKRKGGDAGGAEDPVLEQRVEALERAAARIESRTERVDAALARLEPAIREIADWTSEVDARVAAVEGQLKAMPTVPQLFVALISTWTAGAAIVFTLLKATHP